MARHTSCKWYPRLTRQYLSGPKDRGWRNNIAVDEGKSTESQRERERRLVGFVAGDQGKFIKFERC